MFPIKILLNSMRSLIPFSDKANTQSNGMCGFSAILQRTFGLCQLATSLKKGCGSETNNILTMLISETYYIGTLTSQHASRGLLNYLRSGARVTRVLCSVLARLKPFRRRVRGDAFLRHSSSSCTQAGNGL